ncbi:tetratricopeptide repeat protein [candidate division KSB1 bacterium]|nr:tetratricopeptide repeat protein [candidate division KSB1 bacterium]
MKKSLAYLLMFLPILAEAQIEPFFVQGNNHYQNGEYGEAVAAYKAVLQAGYESPELYYNLGNAYFKLQEIGKAVLYYEKAAKLAPHDADIAHNIQMAQLYVVDRIETPPPFFLQKYWTQAVMFFSRTQLARWTLVLYLLLMALLLVRALTSGWSRHRNLGSFASAVAVVFALCLLVFVARERNERMVVQAVVMQDRIKVLSSPAADANPVFALHKGVKVRVGEQSGPFVQIELPDGKVGWVEQDGLEKI